MLFAGWIDQIFAKFGTNVRLAPCIRLLVLPSHTKWAGVSSFLARQFVWVSVLLRAVAYPGRSHDIFGGLGSSDGKHLARLLPPCRGTKFCEPMLLDVWNVAQYVATYRCTRPFTARRPALCAPPLLFQQLVCLRGQVLISSLPFCSTPRPNLHRECSPPISAPGRTGTGLAAPHICAGTGI